MSDEKLFDVNGELSKRETPVGTQEMKLYSYPPRTIRNMSVLGFLAWLVLLLASIGGLAYAAWMGITGDCENDKRNTVLGFVCFTLMFGSLLFKSAYKRKLRTYTDVLYAVLVDKANHAYVVHLNGDAFLEANGLSGYKVKQVESQGPNMTHVGQSMDSRDMELKAIKMIQRKDFLLKRIRETPLFQETMQNGKFRTFALPVEKILKFKNPGACFVVTYAYQWNGSEYTDTVRFYHSMQDYKELLAYFKERYEAEK